MKHVISRVLSFLLLWALAAPAPAAEQAAEELVMGVEDLAYLPYYAVDAGEYQGFARELFDAFAADTGRRIRYRPLPVERLYRELLDGGIDLKFPDNPDWRADLKSGENFRYSAPVAPFVDGIMVPPQRLEEDAETIRRIGTIRGFTPWTLLPDIERGRYVISQNNSISGLLRQVLARRLDGAYVNEAVAQYQLRHLSRAENALVLDRRLPHAHASYFVSSTRHPAVVRELDGWLAANAEKIAALRRTWGIE